MSKWFYYMRVSSNEQKIDRQLDSDEINSFCKEHNIDKNMIIPLHDKVSGSTFNRENFNLMKKIVSEGDNIIIDSIDRFGRNYLEGRKEFSELGYRGVKIHILDRPTLSKMYTSDDSFNKVFLNFIVDWELANAENDLKRMKRRQRQGIAAAMKNGTKFGRPRTKKPENFMEVYNRWKAKEITAKQAMKELGLKPNKFYHFVKEHQENNNN